jgi:hypothetical protein
VTDIVEQQRVVLQGVSQNVQINIHFVPFKLGCSSHDIGPAHIGFCTQTLYFVVFVVELWANVSANVDERMSRELALLATKENGARLETSSRFGVASVLGTGLANESA